MDKETVRSTFGVFTGHWTLDYHQGRLGVVIKVRLCLEDDKSAEHCLTAQQVKLQTLEAATVHSEIVNKLNFPNKHNNL